MKATYFIIGLAFCFATYAKGQNDEELIVHVSRLELFQIAGIEEEARTNAFGPPELNRAGYWVYYAKGGGFACAVCPTPEMADEMIDRELGFFAMKPTASIKEKFGDRSVSGLTFVMFRCRNVFVYFTWHRKASQPLPQIRDIVSFLKTPSREVRYGTFKEIPKIGAYLKKVKVFAAGENQPSRIHLLLSIDREGLGEKPLFSVGRSTTTSVESVVKSDGTVEVVLIPKKAEMPLKNYPIRVYASGDGLVFAEDTITVDLE